MSKPSLLSAEAYHAKYLASGNVSAARLRRYYRMLRARVRRAETLDPNLKVARELAMEKSR